MTREQLLGDAFVGLSDTLRGDFDLVDLFDRLARHCSALTTADACGILVDNGRGGLRAIAASSESAALLEALQIQTGHGPCVECHRTGHPVHAPDLALLAERWPLLVPVALRAGYRAVHTVPLRLADHTVGAVNLFYTRTGPAPDEDVHLAQSLADVAALTMLHWSGEPHHPQDAMARLQGAITMKATIEQAKGMLAQYAGVPPAEAGTALRAYARAQRRPLGQVAHDLVRRTVAPQALFETAPAQRRAEESASGFSARITVASPDLVVVHIRGQIDLHTADELEQALAPGLGAAGSLVLVETSQVDFIDCSGLRVLFQARDHYACLALLAPSFPVRRLLEAVGADFPSYDSIELARSTHAAGCAAPGDPESGPEPHRER